MNPRNRIRIGCILSAVFLAGCGSKLPAPSQNAASSNPLPYEARQFVPVDPNPLYLVVVKRKGSTILGTTTVQGDQMNQIVKQIHSSHKNPDSVVCTAVLRDGYDVFIHYSYGKSDSSDRTFTVVSCPGTTDQSDKILLQPGISLTDLTKLFQ